MRRREQAQTLVSLMRIRTVQRQAAEMRAAAAAVRLRGLEDQRRAGEARVEQHQIAWSQVMGRPHIPLDLAGAWTLALSRETQALASLAPQVRQAQADRSQCNGEWRTAIAQAQVAEDLANAARRALEQARQDRLLGEVEDRTARQVRAS
ncbi:MAG: hypothetical protein P4L64_09075 [Caulobacteraceae bacterium]|nr:hypothetical protein [Caulobacteraceae bacterium]